jgi:putative DNA primase/helicase
MSSLSSITLDTVSPSPITWLWPGRFARGKVTMLCGDPGLGKSFLTLDMAARITTAADWPDARTPLKQPGSVLVLSAEDDAADTIRPRVEAAGGDPSRIVVADGLVRHEDGKLTGLSLGLDCGAIARRLSAMERPRLIVIDPISAYLGDTDSNNNAEVRAVLAELSRLAARLGPAVLCVSHLNKSPGGKAVYRQMGSLAFTAAARAVWQVAKMPGDEQTRVMTLVKSNIACTQDGITFRVEPSPDGPRVNYLDCALKMSADMVDESPEEAIELPDAVEFLRSALGGGARPAREIIAEAAADGIAERTLKRARRIAGVIASRPGAGRDRPWLWRLEGQGCGPGDGPLMARGHPGEEASA